MQAIELSNETNELYLSVIDAVKKAEAAGIDFSKGARICKLERTDKGEKKIVVEINIT